MGVARLYKTASTVFAADLTGLDYVQTADVVYLFHLSYSPSKIVRSSHTDWDYIEVTWGPTLVPPTGHSVAASTPNMTGYVAQVYNYVVTAVSDATPAQESRASTIVSATNDLSLVGNKNIITLPARPAGVDRFIIYREQSGNYGYIGSTAGTTFNDVAGLQPTLSDTPPVGENPFVGAGNYPSSGAFHQQRLFMGRTRNVPNGVWATQSSDYENLDASRPVKADDALAFALVAEKVNAINHLASMDKLLVLTSDAIWAIGGAGEGDVITPADISPKRQSGRGSSRLKPLVIDNIVLFQPAKGSSVRALGFSFEIDGYNTNNVSIFSPHFFRAHKIMRMAWQEEPHSIVWMLRDDGVLLALTWEQEQEVWGFSLIDVDGFIEDIATITEGGYDRLYALIRRTINGTERRFHERLALPYLDDYSTACHLDCSITQIYDPPRNVVDQLWHLEGATVSASYDGYACHGLVVTNGQIELPNGYEATLVTVGLPYEGEIVTLPPVLQTAQGSLHNNRQQVDTIFVRTVDTKGIEYGATGTDLEPVMEREGDEGADDPDIAFRDYEVPAQGNWTESATITIRQTQPFPAHILGIFYDMKIAPR